MTFGITGSLPKDKGDLETNAEENGLEKRSRELLKRKIDKKGKTQNMAFIINLNKFEKEIKHLVDNEYVIKNGKISEFLNYEVTPKGEEYVIN